MVASVVINGVMAWAFVVTILFCIGDLTAAESGIYIYPIIEILYSSTGSKGGTTALMSLIVFLGIIAMFSTLASVSRLTWAFARDKGLPFSDFFSRVGHILRVPLLGLTPSGSSTSANPFELALPSNIDCYAPQPDQSWLDHCFLRHTLPEHACSVHIVHDSDVRTPENTFPLWHMKNPSCNSTKTCLGQPQLDHQPLCTRLSCGCSRDSSMCSPLLMGNVLPAD